jgi:Flp pilus assembly secretin CpaC
MNASLDLVFWARTVGVLFVQVTVAVLFAWTVQHLVGSGRAKQWCWRAVFVLAACWLTSAVLGIQPRATRLGEAEPGLGREFVIRNNLPVAETTKAARASGHPPASEEMEVETGAVVPVLRGVRWPAYVWLGMATLLALRLSVGHLAIAWWAWRRQREASPAMDELVKRVAGRLGIRRRVTVRTMAGLVSPVTHGCWRVRVVLPEGFEREYSRDKQEAILCHELAHVVARDPLWLTLSELVVAALWWHPLLWWARVQLRQATEQAADEASISVEGGPAALAECLVELGGRLRRPAMSGWLGVQGHDFRSGLGRRVRHLLDWTGHGWRARPSGRQVMSTFLAVVVVMLAGVYAPTWLTPELRAEGSSLFGHVMTAIAADAPPEPKQNPTAVVVAEQEPSPRVEAVDETSATQPATTVEAEPVPAVPIDAEVADQPVVVPAPADALETRAYSVDVRRSRMAFSEMHSGKEPVELAVALRQYLTAAGLDFGSTNALTAFGDSGRVWQGASGRSFMFNEGNGRLLVRATADEHRLTSEVLAMLVPAVQQIVLEAKFIEVEVTEPTQLGFDWMIGQQLITSTNASGAATTVTGIMNYPLLPSLPVRTYASEIRGDEFDWSGRTDPDAHRIRISSSVDVPALQIVDDARLSTFIDALERRNGVDLMAAPHVTTLSGRQTQISLVELRGLVVGIKPEAVAGDESAPAFEIESGPLRTAAFPFGPVLDVIATATGDSLEIHLEVTFSLAEFMGYEEVPGNEFQVWDRGRKTRYTLPSPRLRVRRMNAEAKLMDGQTLLLAGAPAQETIKTKDKVPVLGDIPLLGGLFRSEGESQIRKRLLVVITATRIDPAGNPLAARPTATVR